MKRIVIIFATALFCLVNVAKAVTAYPYPIRFTQPDKSTILTLTMKGDERIKWAETEDGYSLIYNDEGFFCYATKDSEGNMIPSQYIATDIAERSAEVQAFLEQTPKKLFYSDFQVQNLIRIWNMVNENKNKSLEKAVTLGRVKFPVILTSFSNRAFVLSKNQFNNLLNQVSYGVTGSVHDFYYENSYGKMNLEFVVIGPVTLPRTIAYYGNNNNGNSQQFARDAITLANDSVDFAQFDNDNDGFVDGVHIFFAGYGEESGGGADCIWSHRGTLVTACSVDGKTLRDYSCSPELRGSSGNAVTNIGVICHELGHVFGAPDFYDTDYESSGGKYPGTGTWDIMASGSWNGNGAKPAHHNPYTKCYIYHWATPRTLSQPEVIVMNDAETYDNSFYRVETATRNEYFLLENRQNHKFDANIPGFGMLVYRAHSSGVTGYNVNNTHPQKFYVVTAVNSNDIPNSFVNSYGTVESASCPFGAYKDQFTDATTPSAKSWSGAATNKPITNITRVTRNKTVCFTFMGADINPGSFVATPATSTSLELTWGLWNYEKVLLLYSPNGVFGTPQGEGYNAGDQVTGGGTVIYQGYSNHFTHTGLTPQTLYRYKIYSLHNNAWTSGVEASATTPRNAIPIPYFENFDADSNNLPADWNAEATSENYKWRVSHGDNNSYPPYSPTNSMYCGAPSSSYDNQTTILETAPVNTSSVGSAHISFRVRNQKRLNYQDVLTVKYRTSLAGEWTTLAIYNTSMTTWREESLNLPSVPFLQVAFEGTSYFGRGIGIDDVSFAQGSVGINTAMAEKIDVSIYPNPATQQFNISAVNSDENIGFEVFDLMGRQLSKGDVYAHQSTTINTSNWKAGVYVIKLRAGNNEKTHQLIIK